MCIIAVKQTGVKMPKKTHLENCFFNNDDGAGFMFARDGKVKIRKGFMDFDSFWEAVRAYQFTKHDAVVFHFRVATAGAVRPGNCHPFPLSRDTDDLTATDHDCKIAVAHNGILGQGEKKLSDTQVFVRDILADPIIKNNLHRRSIDQLLWDYTKGSKLAILDNKGNITLYGAKWKSNKGIRYSNNTYKYVFVTKSYGHGYGAYVPQGAASYANQGELDFDNGEVEAVNVPGWDVPFECHDCGGESYMMGWGADYFECDFCGAIMDDKNVVWRHPDNRLEGEEYDFDYVDATK